MCGREIALWGLCEWPRWLLDILPLSLPIEMWHRTKMKPEVHLACRRDESEDPSANRRKCDKDKVQGSENFNFLKAVQVAVKIHDD